MKLTTLGVKLACKLLKSGALNEQDSLLLTSTMLNSLNALPTRAIIELNDNQQLVVHGKPLDMESMRTLREAAKNALANQAYTFIREQVAFVAVTTAVHKAETPLQVLFGRAALWYGQQEQALLELLASRLDEPSV